MTARPIVLAVLALAACEKAARIDTDPKSLSFGIRGQTAKVHATPIDRAGRAVPDQICRWSSSDEKVAKVTGPHNDATVTAAGPGSAAVRCAIGNLAAEIPVLVRVVSRVDVKQASVELKVTDEPRPLALEVAVFDDAGAPVQGRAAYSRCLDENVCRGDGRAQLWAIAAGETKALVEVEGAKSAEIAVHVADARTKEGRPQRVSGNPDEAIEREVRKRDALERKQREAEERKKSGQ